MIEYDSALNRIMIYIYQFTRMRKKILREKTPPPAITCDSMFIHYVLYAIKAYASKIPCKKKIFQCSLKICIIAQKIIDMPPSYQCVKSDSNWKGTYDYCNIYMQNWVMINILGKKIKNKSWVLFFQVNYKIVFLHLKCYTMMKISNESVSCITM